MKRILIITALVLSCSSCAFMNRRNRPAMNFCSERLIPEHTAAKAATAVLWAPACLVAGAADAVLLHPVSVMDDAWFQTQSLVWQPTNRGYVTECAVFPLRVAATPPLWALDFARRAVFDVPHWPPAPHRLERLLLEESPSVRLLVLRDLTPKSYTGDDAVAATTAIIKACKAHAKNLTFCETAIARMPAPLTDEALAYLTELGRTGRGRRCAAALWQLFMGCTYRARDDADAARVDKTLETLSGVYDDLVQNGHREAELFIAGRAGYYASRSWRVRAFALHVARSLARRNWPDYAERSAFTVQAALLDSSDAARFEAMEHEWRALRVRLKWPSAVKDAVKRLQSAQGAGSLRAILIRQQNALSEQLRATGIGAKERLQLNEGLVDIKTALDAEEIAERLVANPDNLRLFLGDPLKLLVEKGEP